MDPGGFRSADVMSVAVLFLVPNKINKFVDFSHLLGSGLQELDQHLTIRTS